MSDSIRKHMIRYPAARTSTIQYLARKEEMTARLRAEIAMNTRPKSETTIRAMMRGIAALMDRVKRGF